MRRALIIGAGGQDGRLLAPFLADRGYDVHGWIRRELSESAPCATTIVDILSPSDVEKKLDLLQPNEIYYLAAFHHATEDSISSSMGDLLRRSFDVHVSGLLHVLSAIKRHCPYARLFYAASSHIFGKSEKDWQDEGTPLRPDSPYAISKTAGLRCCQLFRQRENIFAATGILFNHESALRTSSFVSKKIVRGALQARRDPAFQLDLGDLDAHADWGYAPDYVDAMFRILQLPQASDYVVASGELHSVREFVELAFDEVGLDWRDHVSTKEDLLKRDAYPLRGDASKLRHATGWSPALKFDQLVRQLVQETGESL